MDAPEAEGVLAAFAGDGLRWAFGHLSLRVQVAATMEEMLATVEHWKLANDAEVYRLQAHQAEAEATRLRTAYAALSQQREADAAWQAALRRAAREMRDRFVEQLLLVARDAAARDALASKAVVLGREARRVPKLEKELEAAKAALEEAAQKAAQAQGVNGDEVDGDGGEGRPADAMSSVVVQQEQKQKEQQPPPVKPLPPPPPKPAHTLFHTFTRLEEPLLLRVFAYLSAPDVLATAEVCKPFYHRVGAIFGGSGDDNTTTRAPAPAQPEPAGDSGVAPSPGTAAAAASFFRQYGGLLGLGSGGGAGGGEGFSLAALTASLLPPPSRASAAAKSVLEAGPAMSEKVASAVAAKLSGPELKGILAMTDRLKKMEALVGQFQAENEDALQRLSGAEAMKELLLQRLRETELALGRERDGATGAAAQRSSDQEVIGFLDNRVQDLEAALKETAERLVEYREETRREKGGLQEQLRVLRDVLAFERSQAEAKAGEFRQQKRLLAKEVKALRAELLLCQRERDAYRDDLRALRESALGLSGGLGLGGGGRR